MSRHTFRGGNFFMLRMLNRYRSELDVAALPAELDRETNGTLEMLRREHRAHVHRPGGASAGTVTVDVTVENLTGPQAAHGVSVAARVASRRRSATAAARRSSSRDGWRRTDRSTATTTTPTRRASSRTTSEITSAAAGSNLRIDPRRPRQPGDDGSAERGRLPQGQSTVAEGFRQGDGGPGHRRARRRACRRGFRRGRRSRAIFGRYAGRPGTVQRLTRSSCISRLVFGGPATWIRIAQPSRSDSSGTTREMGGGGAATLGAGDRRDSPAKAGRRIPTERITVRNR